MPFPQKTWSAGTALSLLAAVLALTTFFNNQTIEFHQHDTYFIVTAGQLQLPFALLFGIEAWLYHLSRNRKQIPGIKAFHVISCWLLVLVVFWIPIRLSPSVSGVPSRYDDYRPGLVRTIKEAGMMGALVLIFLLGQLFFLVHMVAGLLRKQ